MHMIVIKEILEDILLFTLVGIVVILAMCLQYKKCRAQEHIVTGNFEKEFIMSEVSEVAADVYPLSVEEYESAEVVAEDVEVE